MFFFVLFKQYICTIFHILRNVDNQISLVPESDAVVLLVDAVGLGDFTVLVCQKWNLHVTQTSLLSWGVDPVNIS